ncbi:TetR/AcrR family transcriptional regulator [Agromyces sp. NPDC057679]|uniref:TetR/AcrR family transcriptional regulator n=1 Tax=Agromyces sp. NPDC057679 TaxID=3346207 RepID=UPI00366BA13A
MGRTQTFDTGDVVRAARAVFWEHGFESAALPELERVTGLSRSSIYHAFGSKRGLFDAAVDSYLDEVIRPRLAPLTVDPVAPTALEEYLAGLRDALTRHGTLPASSGCLLVNASASPIGHDDAVARTIASYRAELRAAFGNGVRARVAGGTPESQDLLADICTGLVISALASVRVDPDAAAGYLDNARALIAAHSA